MVFDLWICIFISLFAIRFSLFAIHLFINPNFFIMWHFILFILIGALAGFLAGKIMRGGGFGFLVNLIVGIVGGFIGGWLMSLVGFSKGGLIWELLVAVIGAVVLLWVISLFKKK